jgi:hypothetical protein
MNRQGAEDAKTRRNERGHEPRISRMGTDLFISASFPSVLSV